MKTVLKTVLKYYLRFFARLSLIIGHPLVIAVAGSTNKHFVIEAIAALLEKTGVKVYSDNNSFNTEIGLPLAILGLPSGYNSYRDWLPALIAAPKKIFCHQSTEIIILGFGTSDPNDIRTLLSVAKPNIAVITELTQRYLEGFDGMDQVLLEYETLIKALPKNGLAILNADNRRINELAQKITCKKLLFSIGHSADYQAEGIEKNMNGQKFILITQGEGKIEIQLKTHGRHHIYARLIAEIIKDYVAKNFHNQGRGKE